PQVVWCERLEAVEVLGVVLARRPGAETLALQDSVDGAASQDTWLHDAGLFGDANEAVEGALGYLLLERDHLSDLLGRKCLHAALGSRLVEQALEPASPVAADPGP